MGDEAQPPMGKPSVLEIPTEAVRLLLQTWRTANDQRDANLLVLFISQLRSIGEILQRFDEKNGPPTIEVAEFALPKVLPSDWGTVPLIPPHMRARMDAATLAAAEEALGDAAMYLRADGLRVLVTAKKELDGKRWVHLSMSRADRLPSWEDQRDAKELFLGVETTALQILPPRSKYVNFQKFTLHLWMCLDGDVTPDFTGGRAII